MSGEIGLGWVRLGEIYPFVIPCILRETPKTQEPQGFETMRFFLLQ